MTKHELVRLLLAAPCSATQVGIFRFDVCAVMAVSRSPSLQTVYTMVNQYHHGMLTRRVIFDWNGTHLMACKEDGEWCNLETGQAVDLVEDLVQAVRSVPLSEHWKPVASPAEVLSEAEKGGDIYDPL